MESRKFINKNRRKSRTIDLISTRTTVYCYYYYHIIIICGSRMTESRFIIVSIVRLGRIKIKSVIRNTFFFQMDLTDTYCTTVTHWKKTFLKIISHLFLDNNLIEMLWSQWSPTHDRRRTGSLTTDCDLTDTELSKIYHLVFHMDWGNMTNHHHQHMENVYAATLEGLVQKEIDFLVEELQRCTILIGGLSRRATTSKEGKEQPSENWDLLRYNDFHN